jgi:hypothetical protein
MKISEYTGYENSCEITYCSKGDILIKSIYLEDLKIKKSITNKGKGKVKLISCVAYISTIENHFSEHILSEQEIRQIETKLAECIDWDEFVHTQEQDAFDFIPED